MEEREIKKKVIFGITSLTIGGAERVLVDVANALSNMDSFEISIFSIYSNGELEKQLDEKVKLISMYDKSYTQLTKFEKVLIPVNVLLNSNKIYKKYVKGNMVEIAFLEGPATRIFSNRGKGKKIAWIHNDISQVFGKSFKSCLKRWIDKKIYSKYDQLVFVSEDNLNKFKQVYPNIATDKLQVIYNYIDTTKILEKANEQIECFETGTINFVCVCRLVKQKALDRLINVCGRLKKEQLPSFKFHIIGDGPEKENLQDLIQKQQVEDVFVLHGKKENPYPYIKQCQFFCLLSEFEGYGMVLEEAKILNKDILITDTACREAVKDYPKCVVFENTEDGIFDGIVDVLGKEKSEEKIEKKEKEEKGKEKLQQIIELIEG